MIEKDQNKVFTRRAVILGGIQASLILGLVGRLYVLQVVHRKHYQLLSDKNRIQSLLLPPLRGKIIDRSGIILADNHTLYRGVLNLDQNIDFNKIIEKLKEILFLNEQTVINLQSQVKKRKRYTSVIVKEDLAWDELAKLELHYPDLPGVIIEKGQSRFYPYPFETCHIIGYVAAVSEKDLDGTPLLELPGFKIGKNGIEKTFDSSLRGQPGLKQVEVNATRRVIRTLSTLDSISGNDLKLTLDYPLQKSVYNILQKVESATSVVLDVHTGAVLSLASTPGYNSNLFTGQISKKDWTELSSNPYRPLNNKAASGLYSPGSTFKMIVSLAGLSAGVIDEHTTFHCPGHYDFYGHRFHCWHWKYGGHGNINLESAIAQSCDVYFYNLALLLGVDAIAAAARSFGLGSLTGIELSGEKEGLIPTKSWKRLVKRQAWSTGETLNIAIGQGYVLATPLQLAKMTAMLVNGLHPVTPHLVKKDEIKETMSLDYSHEHCQLILNGMSDAVNKPWGTVYNSRIQEPNFEMGGKTGSTQVCRITQQQRETNTHNNKPYLLREHAIYVGYAPIEKPRFAISVLVEHGGSGARAAAPLGKEILYAAQKLIPA
ncbi:MAG: penicillin-binding protein 2 [Alphaproteobacteria bacterium]|nr:penicillin-binding protein 2 [Alphaproteobacteria bacterium]